jgi:hypothetical protein
LKNVHCSYAIWNTIFGQFIGSVSASDLKISELNLPNRDIFTQLFSLAVHSSISRFNYGSYIGLMKVHCSLEETDGS